MNNTYVDATFSSSSSLRRLLTAADVAAILRISKSQAYTLMRTRELATVRMGRSVRVRQEDLEAFIVAAHVEAERPWHERL